MKKVMKYIVASSVFILGSVSINEYKANAGMKNRIMTTLRNLNCFSCLKGESLNKNINAKVPKNLRSKANELYGRNVLSGVGIDDFDTSNIKDLNSNNWYLQRVNSKGNKITVVAKEKPEIFGIINETVHQKYTNSNGEEVTVFHKGIPNWISGSDLKNKIKMQKRSSSKYRQDLVGIDNLGFTDFDNSTTQNQNITPKRPTTQSNKSNLSVRRGSDLGATNSTFDISEVNEVNPNSLYHQHKSENGKTITIISNGSSSDLKGMGILQKKNQNNQEITVFKNLRWIKGKDLIERQNN